MNYRQVRRSIRYFLHLFKQSSLKEAKKYVGFYSLLPKLMGFKENVSIRYKFKVFYEYTKYLYFGKEKTEDYLIRCVPRELFFNYLSHKTRHYEKGYKVIDKWEFYKLLNKEGFAIPETYGMFKNGRLLDFEGSLVDMKKLPGNKKYFVKPYDASGGLDTKVISAQEINSLSDGLMLQEVLENSGSIRKISGKSSSFNTIRIHTFYSAKTDQITVLSAHLKIGKSGSLTDNIGGGGIGVPIDIKTGAFAKHGFSEVSKEKYLQAHKDAPLFEYCKIDEWDEILDYVFRCSEIIGTQFVGWDIGLSKGKPVAVEANSGGDYFIPQAFFTPYLTTPYIMDFLPNPINHKWINKYKNLAIKKYPDVAALIYKEKIS